MVQPTSFKIGDSVVVKQQTFDPDFGIDIGGWQGRISELQADDILRIDWDSQTLSEMPEAMIAQCEEQGLSWEQIYLEHADVEPTVPRDQQTEALGTYQRLQQQHAFDYLGLEGTTIRQVLSGVDPNNEYAQWVAWEDYLNSHLTFPFAANVAEVQERGVLQVGQTVIVQAITDTDDLRGVLVKVNHHGQRLHFPLCDLEATDSTTDNYQPLRSYVVWFANR